MEPSTSAFLIPFQTKPGADRPRYCIQDRADDGRTAAVTISSAPRLSVVNLIQYHGDLVSHARWRIINTRPSGSGCPLGVPVPTT